jgi:hypothetical protein
LFAACALCSGPALASDGVIEINHAAAQAGGVTPGDAAGYPVSISVPGSYVLTGPLTVTGSTSAIEVTVDDVSIDLNGFAISGPEVCTGSGATLSCSGASGGSGIHDVYNDRLSLHDGTMRGFQRGIATGDQARIERVSISQMAIDGILAQEDAIVRDCHVSLTDGYGIQAGNGAQIRDDVVSGARLAGIFASNDAVVRGNTVRGSGGGIDAGLSSVIEGNSVSTSHGSGIGIYAGGLVTVAGNAVYGNGGGGVYVGAASLVERNTVSGNGNTGITAGSDSTVQRNTVAGNGGAGLSISADATYRENTISGNGGGTVTGTGTNMFSNSCNGATTCP